MYRSITARRLRPPMAPSTSRSSLGRATCRIPSENFQSFLSSNQVDGILGIGANTAGPTTTPFESYGGVYLDIPQHELVVTGTNPIPDAVSTSGSPVSNVLESINGGATKAVTNDHRLGWRVRHDPVEPGLRQLRAIGDSDIGLQHRRPGAVQLHNDRSVQRRHSTVGKRQPHGGFRNQHRQRCRCRS